jgi:hypothetical protein
MKVRSKKQGILQGGVQINGEFREASKNLTIE